MALIPALSAIGLASLLALQTPAVTGQDATSLGAAELKHAVQALNVPDVAWRQIPWKTCLIDGLLDARRTKQPLLLWCQIDRPVDDTRC